ncbi:uncharacterized protein [Nicotiana tomentosiformis]|uniref:uncharacterized protein n=1 Tax=Nicotiana tomentosiformis TaxID=4098 RepID=UPI00388C63B2
MSAYFSKLKELRAEFDAFMPCPGCGCEESKKYVEHFEYQRLLQFLMGLNETYSRSSNRILNMSPRPSINKAYSMIISEESRRALSQSSQVSEVNEGTTLFSNKGTSSGAPIQLNAKGNHGQNHSFLGNEVTALFSSKGNAGASYGHSGGKNHSVYGYRSRRNNLHYDYCNFKGSTANFAGVSQVQQASQNFQAGIPQFTQEQYNQILQLLGKQPECSGSAMAVGMPLCGDITKILAKWIVDSGASNHMLTKEIRWVVMFFLDFFIFQELFSGQVRGIGREEDGIYVFNSTPKKSVALQAQSQSSVGDTLNVPRPINTVNIIKAPNKVVSIALWHKRLGHAPLDTLQKINGSHDFHVVECSSKDKHYIYTISSIGPADAQSPPPPSSSSPISFASPYSSGPFIPLSHADDLTDYPAADDPTVNDTPIIDPGVESQDDIRKSIRVSRPPIWMKDYIVPNKGSAHCCYPISDCVSYANMSPSFVSTLAAYQLLWNLKLTMRQSKIPSGLRQ